MSTYRYPLPRAYRRVRYPYRFKGSGTGTVPAWVIAAVVLVGVAGTGAGAKAVTSHGHPKPAPKASAGNAAAAGVIAFARSKVGKVPYVWGGTTDAGMDCSGLAQSAYASAGISIERTSQDQWASERHVSVPAPGDLVFFAGSDGTPSSPGHVGIVVDPARHTMIDAYASGTYVRYDTYGSAASPGTGLAAVVGFTDPAPVQAAPQVLTAPQAGGSAVATGQRMAASYGWTGGQWSCLYSLWEHESGWSPYAANPTSDARGIPQDINGWSDYAPGDVPAQVAWGLAYIRGRYGTPCAARAFETSHTPNWY